jgi:hypothetical protein
MWVLGTDVCVPVRYAYKQQPTQPRSVWAHFCISYVTSITVHDGRRTLPVE